MELVFGPVPSRRLGLSLGVNNIPPKHCSYSCVYCQLGRTTVLTVERRRFRDPRVIVEEAASKAAKTRPDYVTFVPDGEPTLDACLGVEIRGIKERVDVPVAVITNASLLYREDVRSDLSHADLVSVKVDAVSERVWRLVDRPHPSLSLPRILEGIQEFSSTFRGELISETMLVKGLNDDPREVEAVADYLSTLDLSRAYIAAPIRPPAEEWVEPPSEEALARAYHVFRERLSDRVRVELLAGPEGPQFKVEEDPVNYLIATTAVHPIRLDYAEEILKRRGLDPREVIGSLVERGILAVATYRGSRFLVRRLPRRRPRVE
ncbi:radical SAM protein [Stetteria hydrogenophila]